jgi:indole-3-glycerol phosphate synthase
MTGTTPDLLAAIVAGARRISEVRRTQVSEASLERAAAAHPPGGARFVSALHDSPPPRVIAECKRRSPSRGILRDAYDAPAHAASYAAAGAAAISVLTEPTFFDGSLDDLQRVRAAVSLPLLRKDFIVTRYQVLEAAAAGADAVLLIVGALDQPALGQLLRDAAHVGLAALVEVHDRTELSRALDAGAQLIGVNSRDLRTLTLDAQVHDDLIALMPREVVAVAESGLSSAADVHRLEAAGYRAFLVGERLITQPSPGGALRQLRKPANGSAATGQPGAASSGPRARSGA